MAHTDPATLAGLSRLLVGREVLAVEVNDDTEGMITLRIREVTRIGPVLTVRLYSSLGWWGDVRAGTNGPRVTLDAMKDLDPNVLITREVLAQLAKNKSNRSPERHGT